jgi:hypothetical protein
MAWKIRRRRDERGAVAVLFAALVVVLFIVAALGVDITSQVNRKHLLINQLDSSATAAAYHLGASNGSLAAAVAAAQASFANSGQGTLDLHNVDFWCVVARKLNGDNTPFSPARVADFQIPTAAQSAGVCNPDGNANELLWKQADYQNRVRTWDGRTYSMTCSNTLCAVPCGLKASPSNGWTPGNSDANGRPIRCNTIRVGAEQDVPFSFAGVMGIDHGSTGSQISVACAGSCGAVAPNPMDVVVVADRTLSMTVQTGCQTSYNTAACTKDYRTDVVNGIKSMLQVMTPEQQYVALGALGPSELKRTTGAETNQCNGTQKGLVYPSDQVSTSSKGSWVPITFKKDYLGSPDVNGVRALNTSSKLIQAIDCLDDKETSSPYTRGDRLITTRTALASPLKAAARYLLGKPGDENNIASLGGADRSGAIKKVIIFETDGEPNENSATTSAGALTLDDTSDIFSKNTDYTTTSSTGSPVLGNVQNGDPRNVSPAPPNPYNSSSTYPSTYNNSGSHTITYKYRTSTTTTTDTRTYTGGQKACENFKDIATLAKAAGILVITIGYNLDSSKMCSASNDATNPPGPSTTTDTPWVSDLQPVSCQSGSGTPASPYTRKGTCTSNVTVTYTVPQSTTVTTRTTGAGDVSVTSILADASGGPDMPAAVSNGCSTPALISAENGDSDLFFCAAQGQDMAPLFVTALSKVSSGVKLINLP